MDKEKSFEKSDAAFSEQNVIAEGRGKAYAIGIIISGMLYAIEALCNHTQNYSLLAVVTAMAGTVFIHKYIKLRKKHELIFGICFTSLAVAYITLRILELSGVIN